MIVDVRKLEEGAILESDVCILGAGAAGITIAKELAKTSLKVNLLESGGLLPTIEHQELYQGQVIGLPYLALHGARLRYFGGSTNHWGGVCVPLDPDDFERRDWVEMSGWPFDLSTLKPYYERAQAVCELGPYAYDASALESQQQPFVLDASVAQTLLRQHSPPTLFGAVYRETLASSANVTVYLNANVKELLTSEAGNRVDRATVQCLDGPSLIAKAKVFILGMGGIENARMLLLSSSTHAQGIGNQNDLVGRFFSDHYYFTRLANLIIQDPSISSDYYTEELSGQDGIKATAGLSLSPEVRRREALLNVQFQLKPSTWDTFTGYRMMDPDHTLSQNAQFHEAIARRAYGVLRDLSGLAKGFYGQLSGSRIYSVGAWLEHIPQRSSRITLTDQLDALGQPQVAMDWRMHPQEKDSVLRSMDILAAEFARSGIGRFYRRIDEETQWPDSDFEGMRGGTPGYHHMGTTRMHDSEKSGVVDQNSKIHGVDNLYIAGSSVFPTYGQANPTLTIVALALRLSDHILGKLI